jgi:hypothetical protein
MLDNGWVVAAPRDVGLDGARLSGLDVFLRQWPKRNVHAVVIVRHGRLAFERYYCGRERRWMEWLAPVQFSPETKHDIRSISKSVTSLLVGLAVGAERFPPLDSSVVDYFPEYADLRTPKNVRITFRHLLTMSHGQRWDESRGWKSRANNERQLLEARDPYRYVLEQKVASPPGVFFNYSGGATTLLGAALAKAVGQRIDAYAKEKLFEPLGITDVEWLSFAGSAEIAAFAGLRLRPRDLAKLGQTRGGCRPVERQADHSRPVDRRVDSAAPERRWARSAILWLSLVAWPFLAEWARPRVDCRVRQRRPAPFHRAQARSRHRRERVRVEAFHPGCHPQPVRTACCGRLSAPFRVKGGLD